MPTCTITMCDHVNLVFSPPIPRRTAGKCSSVSVNDNEIAIVVHQPSAIRQEIFCQIGYVNRRKDGINWSEVEVIDKGISPRVAISQNLIVEVHEGRYRRLIYYNVGILLPERREIAWKRRQPSIGSGQRPAVAIHENRVVITYEAEHGYKTYYRLGEMNAQNGEIIWVNQEGRRELFTSAVSQVSIALSRDYAVAAGRCPLYPKLILRIGRFQEGPALNWMAAELTFDYIGFHPAICLDNDRYIVMVRESFASKKLWCTTGRINDGGGLNLSIDWNPCRNYARGKHPTCAISSNGGRVLVEHYDNQLRCYQVGYLLKEERPEQPAGQGGEQQQEDA